MCYLVRWCNRGWTTAIWMHSIVKCIKCISVTKSKSKSHEEFYFFFEEKEKLANLYLTKILRNYFICWIGTQFREFAGIRFCLFFIFHFYFVSFIRFLVVVCLIFPMNDMSLKATNAASYPLHWLNDVYK